MKKILLTLIFIFTCANAFAYGIGPKIGYATMYDDYSNLDDTLFFGIVFDTGTFIFRSLQFRPSIDYLTLEHSKSNYEVDVWGIHLDWYWFFMGKKSFSPFLGFGPALNYYDYNDNSTQGDSDAGLEGFVGIEFNLQGPWSLIVEARYLWHDIADRDSTIIKYSVSLLYYF